MSIFSKIFNRENKQWSPNTNNLLISFSIKDINTGQVNSLIKYLNKYVGLTHIMEIYNNGRCELYALEKTREMEIWFGDRNPYQLEEFTKKLPSITSGKIIWQNGFEQKIFSKMEE